MIVVIFIASFLILAGVGYALYRQHRRNLPRSLETPTFPEVEPVSLFDQPPVERTGATRAAEVPAQRERLVLLERARKGDAGALTPAAATGDWSFYREVLDSLVDRASCQEDLEALVSRTVNSSELRATRKLAECLMDVWKTAPNRRLTSQMLHVAALSDDPACYHKAVEAALEFWRQGRMKDVSGDELATLIEHEYWVLAPGARRSGEAHLLKSELAGLRRQLAAAKPNASS